jgi:hypothetical protein
VKVDTSRKGESERRGERDMNLLLYEHRTMKPIAIALKRGGEV